MSRQTIIDRDAHHGTADDGGLFHRSASAATPRTAMIGNLIDGQLSTPGLLPQGTAPLSLLLLVVLLPLMAYYVLPDLCQLGAGA